MLKSILYLTPKLNHYKFRQLNLLGKQYFIDILSGYNETEIQDNNLRSVNELRIDKNKFSHDKRVRQFLRKYHNNYDFILVPFEKKFLTLIVYAKILKIFSKKDFCIITHNHPLPRSGFFNQMISLISYNLLYDKVIFYTEYSCRWASSKRLIPARKAFWANNTIDNEEVNKYYEFKNPPNDDLSILFIGRLIPSKRLDFLLDYYSALKGRFSIENRSLRLEIIGDGPHRGLIQSYATRDPDIIWHGTLTEENRIAPIMARSTVVFIPGASGLSINHAFAYGRPYITLQSKFHGPEISYLEDGANGLLLTGSFETNVEVLYNLLTDRDMINAFCDNAKEKGRQLSINNWVEQIKQALDA